MCNLELDCSHFATTSLRYGQIIASPESTLPEKRPSIDHMEENDNWGSQTAENQGNKMVRVKPPGFRE